MNSQDTNIHDFEEEARREIDLYFSIIDVPKFFMNNIVLNVGGLYHPETNDLQFYLKRTIEAGRIGVRS